jgi:hypothetical protein
MNSPSLQRSRLSSPMNQSGEGTIFVIRLTCTVQGGRAQHDFSLACWKQPDIPVEVDTRGRPSANAANSYLEFTACKSQKFGHWANIRPLLEKAKKLTICIGNSAPLKTFLLKSLEKFDYRFLRKQKLFIGPF